MSALEWLGIVATVVGLGSTATGVALYVRAGYAKARIEDLRTQLTDERNLTASLRGRVEHLERDSATKGERLTAVEHENATLRKAPQLVVDGLAHNIADLHTEVTRRIDVPTSDLAEAIDAVAAGVRAALMARGGGGR